MTKRVAVYRKDLLPISETFIRDQFLSYRQWTPVLLGQQRAEGGIDISGLPHKVLQPNPHAIASKIAWKASQILGWSRKKLIMAIESLEPEIIHAHFGYDALLVHNASAKLGIPLIVTLHGSDICYPESYYQANPDPFMRLYIKRLKKMALAPDVHFIAVSDAIKISAIEKGIPESKIHVRHTGVNIEYFCPSTTPIQYKPPKVLFIGRLVEFKGCDVLIKAIGLIKNRIPNVELTIIGEGPEKRRLIGLAADEHVTAHFTGSLPRTEVKHHLQEARAFCLPSRFDRQGGYEAFGSVILEAQACGVPTLTSAHGSKNTAISHGKTGFRFEADDYHELASLLERVLTDNMLAHQMATNGPAFVKDNFDISNCTKKIELLYESVLQ